MTVRVSLFGLLDRVASVTRSQYDADRRANPHRFQGSTDGAGPEHLFAENVARLVGCNVDFVRRISREDLPAAKVGARLIYSRRDVEAYIARCRQAGTTRPRHRQELQRGATTAVYDPVVHVRELLKGTSE